MSEGGESVERYLSLKSRINEYSALTVAQGLGITRSTCTKDGIVPYEGIADCSSDLNAIVARILNEILIDTQTNDVVSFRLGEG